MIEQALLGTVIEGFPSLAALLLMAWVFVQKDRASEQREREREQWFMSLLERVIRHSEGRTGCDDPDSGSPERSEETD